MVLVDSRSTTTTSSTISTAYIYAAIIIIIGKEDSRVIRTLAPNRQDFAGLGVGR